MKADRLASCLFIIILIALSATHSYAAVLKPLLIAVPAASLLAVSAYYLGWLSRSGSFSATVVGTLAFGLGSWTAAVLLLLFVVGSYLVAYSRPESREGGSGEGIRNGLQVWSNGFWFSAWTVFFFYAGTDIWLIAMAASLATAASDTWATELGSRRFGGMTYLITNFDRVPPGTDGGVSVYGTAAALAGSGIISAAAVYMASLNLIDFFILLMAGFLGCLADSYFGATFQGGSITLKSPLPAARKFTVDNNMVNWMATGLGSLIAIFIKRTLI